MKQWLAKFRISAALDTGKRLPEDLRRQVAGSPELQQFISNLTAVERELKTAPRQCEPSPLLHQSIMGRVRQAARPAKAPSNILILRRRWLPVPALALLVAFGLWWLMRPAPPPPQTDPSLAAAGTALQLGEALAQTMPSAAVAPLTQEWEHLNRDLQNTAQLLLASLPY